MKKVLTLLVAIIAGIGTLYAEVVSGSCSTKYQTTDVVWSIDLEIGLMTISGTGVFPEYSHVSNLPWNDYSELIKKGQERLKDFNWAKTAEITKEVYKKILS